MEHLLNQAVQKIEISGIRKFFNLVSNTEDMISLTIGQPDFPTPDYVKTAGISAIENNYTSYTHNAGFIELREAASQYIKKHYHLDYKLDEIIVTSGASQALDVTLRTILAPNTEVILPSPVYPGYEPLIKLCGAKPVFVDTTMNQFKLTASLIKQAITANTRCIILPYPSNPTGVSLSKHELQEIADLIKGKEIFVIADEIYSALTYENEHVSIASYLKDQTIVINGLSKSHSMTGWRIGFTFAPRNITKHMLKVHQYNVSCASSISQKAAIAALSGGETESREMLNIYKERRDFVFQRLQEMELETVKPDGAFYFFVKIPSFITENSFDFALNLAKKAKVAVVPGSAFSGGEDGYFRISFACSLENLEEGLHRIDSYLTKVRLEEIG
ncbi:aminotransferase A [Bacillus spongiae]|uniref:Aminotransferase n=1 Tax=Bacillus spongiae TaxID=2683610 RepID=A0ABU8H9H9_9BACI